MSNVRHAALSARRGAQRRMFAPSAITICASARVGGLIFFWTPTGRQELEPELEALDRLKFRDVKKYKDRLSDARKKTGEKDALLAMPCGLSRGFLWLSVRF